MARAVPLTLKLCRAAQTRPDRRNAARIVVRMTTAEDRLDATWPFVRAQLPTPRSNVIEIGCGSLGGLVPRLVGEGYDAVGIDPEAPEAPGYHRVEFERFQLPPPVDAVVACTSLHHVADLDDVLDRVAASLAPGGVVVIVEWSWERFDEATATWCFSRLETSAAGEESGWLHRHREGWSASDHAWDAYLRGWATEESLPSGELILQALDARFERDTCTVGRYFFPIWLTPPRQPRSRPSMRARSRPPVSATPRDSVGSGRCETPAAPFDAPHRCSSRSGWRRFSSAG